MLLLVAVFAQRHLILHLISIYKLWHSSSPYSCLYFPKTRDRISHISTDDTCLCTFNFVSCVFPSLFLFFSFLFFILSTLSSSLSSFFPSFLSLSLLFLPYCLCIQQIFKHPSHSVWYAGLWAQDKYKDSVPAPVLFIVWQRRGQRSKPGHHGRGAGTQSILTLEYVILEEKKNS